MPKIKSIKRYTFEHKMLKFGEANDHETEYLSLITHYDDKGNMSEEQKVNPENEVEEINTFTYNENGKLMEHVMLMVMDDAKEILKNERDDKGRLVKEQKYYGNDPGEATMYVYNDKDEVIEIHKTDEEGEGLSKEVIEYNEKGNIVKRTKYDGSGTISEKTEIGYDDRENISSKTEYDEKNNLKSKTEYSYDDKNALVSSVEKNAAGKLTESITYQYDVLGNVVERNIRDFHPRKIKFVYDDKNHCIEEEVYDQHGNLAAKNIYEYDEQGNVISELNYNMDINRMSRENNTGHRYEYEFYVE
jgi:antitoxin component YwqK of YwqJK toxin-antitoxin module